MKVLIYYDKTLYTGGVDVAINYQIKALQSVGVEVTTNPEDSYDLVDLGLFFGKEKKIAKKCKKLNIPVIMHGHSSYAEFKKGFALWPILMFFFVRLKLYSLYKIADYAIPVSNFVKHILQPDLVYYDTPMTVISNAIDISEFNKNEKYVQLFEKTFNIKPDEKVVVNSAGPSYRKGFFDFLKIAERNPDVKFIWFGDYKGITCQRKIKRAIKHRPKNVIMPGYIRNNLLYGAFQRADCILYPSYIETDGYVALEALASKTPLLIRDIGSMEWLENNIHCYKANSLDEFNDKLHIILNSDNSDVINAAYKKVQERDLKVIGQQLKSLYEKIIKDKRHI